MVETKKAGVAPSQTNIYTEYRALLGFVSGPNYRELTSQPSINPALKIILLRLKYLPHYKHKGINKVQEVQHSVN